MSNDTVVSLAAPARISDPLTELLRTGARRLIEAAVTAEFEEYLSAFVQEQLPDGRQRVVRNGHLPERKILTGLEEPMLACRRFDVPEFTFSRFETDEGSRPAAIASEGSPENA